MVKKMLLMIALILATIICIACSTTVKEKETMKQELKVDKSYIFNAQKIKKSKDGIREEIIIPDKTIALEYSNMILEKVLKKDINEYKEVDINYDSKKGVWILTYGLGKEILGGDINIAIDKKTGEVLLIWSGE